MPTLYHEIQVLTSADRVWNLLTTRQGLNRWWPGEVTINGGDSWRFNRPEAESDWDGRGAERLALDGDVNRRDFESLLNGYDPKLRSRSFRLVTSLTLPVGI